MKICSVLLVLVFFFPGITFAKRRKTSNFKRRHAVVLNTQNLFQYDEFSTRAAFNLAYAYNLGNFEFQPYIAFSMRKPKSGDFSLNNLLLGLSVHFNIVENRRGKRLIPYILASGAYDRPGDQQSGFGLQVGGGFKYFLTSRFVVNPEVFYDYRNISSEGSSANVTLWEIITNLSFRYYF